MSHPDTLPVTELSRLTSRAEFEAFQAGCISKWTATWADTSYVVTVGLDSSSLAKGAANVFAACELALHGTDAIVRKSSGNGAIWMEPWVEIKRPGEPPIVYGNIEPNDVPALLNGELQDRAVGVRGTERFGEIPTLDSHPFFKYQQRIVLADTGIIDPDSIEEAIARGAYSAYFKVLFEMSDEEAIAEVTAATLRGRGGAGFPAGIKWESGRKARATPKYVVCNSHEGEPNVYKDRRIHEGDPHRILEGLLIACVCVGAERGYNYIGGEYPLAIKRFRRAVADAERLGLIGKNVLGSGKDVAFRVRTGGGAYICGEGSALMYSVMGVRGQPRTKPPRSVEEGIWKRPTVANNTETVANIRDIINKGGEWFASIGTEKSTGTKLMTVQGPMKTPGLIEVPMGINLGVLYQRDLGRDARRSYVQGYPDRRCLRRAVDGGALPSPGRLRLPDRVGRHARLRRFRRLRHEGLRRRLRPLPDRLQPLRVLLEVRPLPAGQPGPGRNPRPHPPRPRHPRRPDPHPAHQQAHHRTLALRPRPGRPRAAPRHDQDVRG